MLIDTGAATTVFHRKALLGMQLPAGDKVETQMAGGQTVTAEQIQFQYIEVGPFREQDARTLVIDPQGPNFPYDGILGMDFLQSHPYEVDTKHEQLVWKDIV